MTVYAMIKRETYTSRPADFRLVYKPVDELNHTPISGPAHLPTRAAAKAAIETKGWTLVTRWYDAV